MNQGTAAAPAATSDFKSLLAEARSLLAARQLRRAVPLLEEAVRIAPGSATAWRLLGDARHALGDAAGGGEAHLQTVAASVNDKRLMEAAAALADGRLPEAEHMLRDRLKAQPTNVPALRMFAELAARLGRYAEAQTLLERAIELAPGFDAARYAYALVLSRQSKLAPALEEVDRLLDRDPQHFAYRNLKASVLVRMGDYLQAIALYESVLADRPDQPKIWMSLGHVRKTLGRTADGIAAYRRSIELAPGLGESWWSLANLKTFRFTPEDVERMRQALGDSAISPEDRFHLHFALGKALEDSRDHAASFRHYAEGNRMRREQIDYDAAETSAKVARAKALYTPAFLKSREGQGDPAPDPIFVVGLPRAGSTLIEQILASHSAVEGTMELPDIDMISRRIASRGTPEDYPGLIAALAPHRLAELGAEYLERTRVQRRLGRPLFVDKMPNNWQHVGLIHLVLPNAKIIDARRHPMAGCFSAWKQHFARGQSFTYDLAELGRYYSDYVELIAHFDAVLPGRVHRVIYERMVADPEGETRRLLDYCGLPFEEACLRFHENDRAVRTASSEQVRRPIFTDAVEQWRSYEPWLAPLAEALGDVASAYPDAPDRLKPPT